MYFCSAAKIKIISETAKKKVEIFLLCLCCVLASEIHLVAIDQTGHNEVDHHMAPEYAVLREYIAQRTAHIVQLSHYVCSETDLSPVSFIFRCHTYLAVCVSSLRVTVTAFFFVFLWYQQKSAAPGRLVGAAEYRVY